MRKGEMFMGQDFTKETGDVEMGTFIDLPIKEVHDLYAKERLSSRDIANKFHCSSTTVLRRLKKSKAKIPTGKRITIQKHKLKHLYVDKKRPLQEIAEEFNCNKHTVIRRLHEFGFIKTIQKKRKFTITRKALKKLYLVEKNILLRNKKYGNLRM